MSFLKQKTTITLQIPCDKATAEKVAAALQVLAETATPDELIKLGNLPKTNPAKYKLAKSYL